MKTIFYQDHLFAPYRSVVSFLLSKINILKYKEKPFKIIIPYKIYKRFLREVPQWNRHTSDEIDEQHLLLQNIPICLMNNKSP